ncbi:hypothetical protein PTW37_11115 [Arthrobacter agilis]|uniref:hypothetical protein n=1 Tax=Arthrobacter agilis TaxID=37921 RepID=UPI002366F3EE|nr:hypothetical protein [Arthrobacter agilis]WDF32417.1 hypothetical protein PTW37_11115 [Arthrobacter agilis]
MRWDDLFTDLELQLQTAMTLEQEGEIRDRTRAEQSRLTLAQRLGGHVGGHVAVGTRGGRTLTGVLTNVGSGWIALLSDQRSILVPVGSLQVLRGLGRSVGQPLAGVDARLGLGSALRVLSRNRSPVSLWSITPASRFDGVIDRVGADFLELGGTTDGDARGRATRRDIVTVPFASIDTVDAARPRD